jgi:hypothetical protein
MKQIVRPGFRAPPQHQHPEIEDLLGKAVHMMQIQALNIEALINCIGRDRFEAGLETALKSKAGKPEDAA